jgi:hypothetical protein
MTCKKLEHKYISSYHSHTCISGFVERGKWHEMVDWVIGIDYPVMEVMRCVKATLICVIQNIADDRLNMSDGCRNSWLHGAAGD